MKQVYPYEYMDSWDRFIETSLQPEDAFNKKLRVQTLSDEEYAYAQKVWSTFGWKTILDYHHIYLKSMYLHLTLTTPPHPSTHHGCSFFTNVTHLTHIPITSTTSSR